MRARPDRVGLAHGLRDRPPAQGWARASTGHVVHPRPGNDRRGIMSAGPEADDGERATMAPLLVDRVAGMGVPAQSSVME